MQHSFFLEVPVRAASRTRCACRGRFPTIYNDPAYKSWLTDAIEKLKAVDGRPFPDEPNTGDVWVALEVIARRPKTTKRLRPKGDRDNHEKGVFDAITQAGGWWKDDDQIVEGPFLKRWANDNEPEGYKVTVRFRDDSK